MTGPAEKAQALASLSQTLRESDLRVLTCLRHKAEASVFLGEQGGLPVILKQFHLDGPARLLRMKAELDLVGAQMAGGTHGINRLLQIRPEIGVAVLEHAGDRRLSQQIAEAPAQRPALMRQAADWLLAYVGPRRRAEAFRPRRWIERLPPLADPPSDHDRTLRLLRQFGRELAGSLFTRAATHGDFVSINAMWRNGRIIGVDVQGESWLPLVRDMARFLVWQEITDPAPGPREWGIAAADLAAFRSAPLLDPAEAQHLLPFFIGLQLVQRLSDLRGKAEPEQRAITALGAWCEAARHGLLP